MKKKNTFNRILILTVFACAFSTSTMLTGQVAPEEKGLKAIDEDVIRAQMNFLASDWMEGREAGKKGERMAGEYIASMLQVYGIKPFGDLLPSSPDATSSRSYFQNFTLLKILPGDEPIMQIRSIDGKTSKITTLNRNVDFVIFPSEQGYELNAPVVFIGYGFRNERLRFDDFAKIDIKGKFVLKLSGLPKFATETFNRAEQTRALREGDSLIKVLGAAGIIEFRPDVKVVGRPEIPDFLNMSPAENEPGIGSIRARYQIPGEKTGENIVRIQVSVRTANEILKGSSISINDYLTKADQNHPVTIPQITNREIFLKSSVSITQVPVRNVLGIIEGRKKDNIIVLGAHYDHVGLGKGYIWNGADDNASGTVGVMTIAKAIRETGIQPDKTIVFALWTSEEAGLLGSRYYLDNLSHPVTDININLNFDMISRYVNDKEPNKVTMTYTDKYPLFKDMTVANLRKYGIELDVDYQPSPDPPGGSDHRSFTAKGIPVMRFKPGHREEYHMPSDEVSIVDWDIMEKIIKISFLNTWQLANSEW